jgi:hypothetical protein
VGFKNIIKMMKIFRSPPAVYNTARSFKVRFSVDPEDPNDEWKFIYPSNFIKTSR